ncbi:Aldo/keto reductase, partial [Stipitochalara longipes BDJ]
MPLILGLGVLSEDLHVQNDIVEAARVSNIKCLDTARHYNSGRSEKFIGDNGLSSEFQIITKAPMGLTPGGSTKEGILKQWEQSAKALKTGKVSMYLLHVPDDNTPISETMEGIQALYLAGKFQEARFGLSNFTVEQVEECYNFAKARNYVLPTVYQSVYSVVNRQNETTLFPTLRRFGISIQGYSALASGFLVRTSAAINAGSGNFNPNTVLGKILHDMYGKPSYLAALEEFGKLAEEAGTTKAGLAYRWVVWNSFLDSEKGDTVVLGASSGKQLSETVSEIEKGPLEGWVVQRLEELWRNIEADAPGNNFETFTKLTKAGLI